MSTQKTEDKADKRDSKGRFLPGVRPGPGAPRGKKVWDVARICESKAKAEGLDIKTLIWSVMKGVILKASKGDAACAKLVLERLCGPVEKESDVQVNIDARGGLLPQPSLEDVRRALAQAVSVSGDIIDADYRDAVEEIVDGVSKGKGK